MSDTERFVDEAEKTIAPQNTWETLSVPQLIDVKIQLQERLLFFRNQPQISTALKQGIEKLDRIMAQRAASSI